MRIAALRLPSSIFDVTADANDASGSRLSLSFVGPSAIDGAASLVQRFLIALAKLWRLPPRGGFARMLGPNCSKFIQACGSSGLEETLSRRSASTELQDTLAAFGMCLIVPSGAHGCENGAVVKPGAVAVSDGACGLVASAVEMIVCWFARVAGSALPVLCSKGGLPVPLQGLEWGPWR